MKNIFKKIDSYLEKEYAQPLIVDVPNPTALNEIQTKYDVGTNRFIHTAKFCSGDEYPRLEQLFHILSISTQPTFVVGLSTYMKLHGEQFLKEKLQELLSMSIQGHIVIITYQCKKHLSFVDPRLLLRIIIVPGEDALVPAITLTSSKLITSKPEVKLNGLSELEKIEQISKDSVSLITEKSRELFPRSLLVLKNLNSAYDALCQKDSATMMLDVSLGSEQDWIEAFSEVSKEGSWADLIDSRFGDKKLLFLSAKRFSSMPAHDKWLYLVGLKLFGAENAPYLKLVASKATSTTDFVRQAYRALLEFSPNDKQFQALYENRKQLLNDLQNHQGEAAEFCSLIHVKNREALHYLTDNTAHEKKEIFKLLDQYGVEFERKELEALLKSIYPDLYAYMTEYSLKTPLLSDYFNQYKYQKVINRILPEFEAIVLEQAESRDYNTILDPRTSIIESIDRTNTQLYFMDAMGVEYLSFIESVCKEMELVAIIRICRCELPSITKNNKEFLDVFSDSPFPCISFKDLDEIKHHGEKDYDYTLTRFPLHLGRELELIRNVLGEIRDKLKSGPVAKVVMISDHGASRLAVIHETETVWEMPESGEHSGRCCLKSEIDKRPDCATDAGDYWALANYDRFKGGRKANVEVHGGATLEEVVIPIIELTLYRSKIEVYLLSVDDMQTAIGKTPIIRVSFRKKAALKIFSVAKLEDIVLRVNGRSYEGKPNPDGAFIVEMPDIRKVGMYKADVLSAGKLVAAALPFEVRSEGMESAQKGIL